MDRSTASSLSDLRQHWIQFVTGDAGLTRFLSGFGNVALAQSPSSLALAEIIDFLQLLSRSGANYSVLLQAILLLGRARQFVGTDLPTLLRSLNHEVGRTEEIVGPALKGKPLWGDTALSRATGRIRPYEFVARRPERSADLPENRLLKILLSQMLDAIRLIEIAGAGGAVGRELSAMRAECSSALKSGAMTNVTLAKAVTPIMRARANRARNSCYRAAAEIQLMLSQTTNATRRENWAAALALLEYGWLEPVSNDDLFELFTLAMLLSAIEASGCGPPTGMTLLTGDRSWITSFKSAGLDIEIYFDQSPASQLNVATEYGTVVGSYTGVTGGPRRPDITVVLNRLNGERNVVILECKNTERSSYVSDSIYKVFGYLQDFRSLWGAGSQKTRAILVVPDGVETKSLGVAVDQQLRLISGTDRRGFEDLVAAVINEATLL